ncbi:MAG TPA: SAF domain-containing protein [Ornithinibacter sp.]|nr:SAF domain-containing protein [Ornithinibacter sp.]
MPRPPRPLPGLTGPGRRARWRRVVLRRVLSAVLAATSVVLVILQLRPPPEPVTPVVVAVRDLPAGSVLTEADLGLEGVPERSVQPGALAAATDAVGRRVAAGLARGETLTASRLAPRGPLDGLPTGRVALHVVSADPAGVDLLAPGLSARVYPVAGGPALAVAATVLATDPPGRGGTGSLSDPSPRGVVLSLSATEADAVLAGHGSLEGPVTVTVVASAG